VSVRASHGQLSIWPRHITTAAPSCLGQLCCNRVGSLRGLTRHACAAKGVMGGLPQ